jgi:hypothetical protein
MNLNNYFMLNYKKVSESNLDECRSFNNVVDNIYNNLPLPNKGYLKIHKIQALNDILCNLKIANDNKKVLAVSRSKNYYNIPSQYGIDHYSYYYFIPIIDALKEAKYIGEAPGYYDKEAGSGKITRIWVTLKLMEQFLNPVKYKTLIYNTPIILKDCDKHFQSYRNRINRSVKQMESFLNKYNDFISSNKIQFVVSPEKMTEIKNTHLIFLPSLLNTPLNIYNIIISEAYSNKYYTTSTPLLSHSYVKPLYYKNLHSQMYRVFNNSSFSFGGRFYGAEYQQLNGQDRQSILINDNKTTEIDFKGLHINMLYNKEGKDFNDDPYSVVNSNSEIRPVLKLIGLIIINAKDKKSSIDAVNYELWKNPELKNIKERYNLSIQELFSDFEKRHPDISNYFNSGIGLKLQNLDSKIAEGVMKHFTRKERVCLCIHDSFIVEESDKEELAQVMKEAYRKYLGFPGKVEIKF